eukprot:XP_003723822.2 PREDICTED: uncharacterized protein LOC100893411 [Strongylocentrotus purpuratus]
MPKLTDLTLRMELTEEFCSTLKANASSIQVQTLKLDDETDLTNVSSHHLAEALCSMPNLTDLTLKMDLTGEFYSALKAKASSIQVQTLKLDDETDLTHVSSHHLAEALCSMPNLTDLTLRMELTEEFYTALKAKASFIQGCFPQIRMGNFRFNGVAQDDLDSFLHTLTCLQSLCDSDGSSDSSTSDTVLQLSQTHREGISSLSRPYKRQAPSTQSRVPQDDPEIPEKQAKYEV